MRREYIAKSSCSSRAVGVFLSIATALAMRLAGSQPPNAFAAEQPSVNSIRPIRELLRSRKRAQPRVSRLPNLRSPVR